MILTTEVITDVPEKEKGSSMPPGGGWTTKTDLVSSTPSREGVSLCPLRCLKERVKGSSGIIVTNVRLNDEAYARIPPLLTVALSPIRLRPGNANRHAHAPNAASADANPDPVRPLSTGRASLPPIRQSLACFQSAQTALGTTSRSKSHPTGNGRPD